MKKMSALLMLSLLAIASCSREDDPVTPEEENECGEEGFTGMWVNNLSDWEKFSGGLQTTLAYYKTDYAVAGGFAGFGLTTSKTGLCPKESALISAQMETLVDDNEVVVTCGAQEGGGSTISMPMSEANGIWNGDNFFVFSDREAKSADLTYTTICKFPTKGSWEADRDYFFGVLLKQIRLDANFKVPK